MSRGERICKERGRHEPIPVPPTFPTIIAVCRICGHIFRKPHPSNKH